MPSHPGGLWEQAFVLLVAGSKVLERKVIVARKGVDFTHGGPFRPTDIIRVGIILVAPSAHLPDVVCGQIIVSCNWRTVGRWARSGAAASS